MAEYASGQVTVQGLGNGTDFSEMIAELKKIELRHAQQLSRWHDDWVTRLEAFGQIRVAMADFSAYMKTMNSEDKFMVKSAAVSNPSVAVVSNTSGAIEGSYHLNVNQLASNSYASAKVNTTSLLEPINTSGTNKTFSFTYGSDSTVHSYNITDSTNLEGLKNAINQDPANKNVRATILEAGGEFVLQLYSLEQGAGTDIHIQDNGTNNLAGLAPGDWQLTAGQNAKVRLNHVPAGDWYEFSGNKFKIYGMEVTLSAPGETTITVATDKSAIEENVYEFVDKFNSVLSVINTLTDASGNNNVVDQKYAESLFEMQQGSVLTGNYGVQLMKSMLKSAFVDQARGFEYFTDKGGGVYEGDIFSSMSQIGIKIDHEKGSSTYGLFIFETDPEKMTFEKALNEYPEGIAELFSAQKKAYSDSTDFGVYSTMTRTQPGKYDVKYQTDASGNVIDTDTNYPTINGKRAKYYPDTNQLGLITTGGEEPNDADGIVLLLYNPQPGQTYEGTVRLKEGKLTNMTELIDTGFLKAYSDDPAEHKGTLSILEKQYENIIKNIKDKISKEEERVNRWETHMKRRFSNLDTVLKQYDLLNTQIATQIKQLPGYKTD